MRTVRVLVVDDEPAIRDSLAGVLGDEGFEVDCAPDGESCLTKLAEWSVDVGTVRHLAARYRRDGDSRVFRISPMASGRWWS